MNLQRVTEIIRRNVISDATYYKWKSNYRGLEVSQLRKLKDLELENSRLKKMYADLSLVHEAYRDAVEKKL